jgi:hypothetical protein
MKKGLLSLTLVLAISFVQAQVMFNQVFVSNQNHQQFVELYNPSVGSGGVNLDCYSLVTFYRTNEEQGFYVLDFPRWQMGPQAVLTATSNNVQGMRGSAFSWNQLPEGASLKKYIYQNGRFGYLESPVGAGFRSLFNPGNGVNGYVVMLFEGQTMVDAFLGDQTNALPGLISQMPDLTFTSSCGTPVNISFNALNQAYAQIWNRAGSSFTNDHGVFKRINGRCGEWYGSLRLSQNGSLYNAGYSLNTRYDRRHNTVSYDVQRSTTAPTGYTLRLYIDKQPYGIFGQNDLELSVQSPNGSSVQQAGSFTNVAEDFLVLVLDAPGDCYDIVRPLTAEDALRPLPVNFTWFDIRQNNAQVQVAWQTAIQHDTRGFEVQSRIGQDAWRTIAYVVSDNYAQEAGDARDRETARYVYGDNNPSADRDLQYRVKVISRDGSYGYSETRTIPSQVQNRPFRVYPNPTSDGRVFLAFNEYNGFRDIQLIDMSGNLVNQWRSVNSNTHQINHLKPGHYVVRVLNRESGSLYTEKIVVGR